MTGMPAWRAARSTGAVAVAAAEMPLISIPRSIEHATGGAEVVLHIDHEHRCPGRIEPDRLWSRVNRDHAYDVTGRRRIGDNG